IAIAPQHLRRTFAKLAHYGRSPLEQIQLSLGHESIVTTERYLGVRQNISDAPCDHLRIELTSFIERTSVSARRRVAGMNREEGRDYSVTGSEANMRSMAARISARSHSVLPAGLRN